MRRIALLAGVWMTATTAFAQEDAAALGDPHGRDGGLSQPAPGAAATDGLAPLPPPPIDAERAPSHAPVTEVPDAGFSFRRMGLTLLGATVGQGIAAGAAAAIGRSGEDCWECMDPVARGSMAAAFLSTALNPGGAFLAHRLAGGRGSWGAGFLGYLAGSGIGLIALALADFDPEVGLPILSVSQVLGSTLGLEVNHVLRSRKLAARSRAITPLASPRRGGATLGLSGVF